MTSHIRRFLAVTVLIAGIAAGLGLRVALADAATPQLIQPAELVKLLQSAKGQKPLIIQVGFRKLYDQAHIPGAEYVGPASSDSGRQQLRDSVAKLPRSTPIILYCGCCPWSHCPNVNPAYSELVGMKFSNVKVLYIADNFGADWVEKGYPIEKRN